MRGLHPELVRYSYEINVPCKFNYLANFLFQDSFYMIYNLLNIIQVFYIVNAD